MIFQDPITSLNPVLTIGFQITEPLNVHIDLSNDEANDRAVQLLELVGIPEAKNRLKDYPHQFSGGMRQRVMIPMALTFNPGLLIADEPTTAPDVTIQAQNREACRAVAGSARNVADLDQPRPGFGAGLADHVNVMYAEIIVKEEKPMKSARKSTFALGLLVLAAFAFGACTPEEVQVVQTAIVEVDREVQVTVVVEPTAVPPQQGGTIITSAFADATILNPILWNDNASATIGERLFLSLVDEEPFTGELLGEIASGWEVSEDGLTYTFTLRDDIEWSDGTPLTANDFKFSFDAIASDLVETPRKSNIELVDNIEVIDDQTVNVTFTEVDCTALSNFTLGMIPSHMYAADFSDIMESAENTAPSVVSGQFMFQEWVPDDHVTLVRNDNFADGASNADGWIYRVFADESAELAALLAGETDITGVGSQFVSIIEGRIASGDPLDIYKFFDDGYNWIAMNQANPDNPQNGFEDLDGDEAYTEGEPLLPQDPHPILGNVAVRQAISQAVDVQSIVNKVAFGQGAQLPSNVLPAVGWAFDNTLQPYTYDPEADHYADQ